MVRIFTTKSYQPETPLHLIDKHKVNALPIAAFDLIACLKTDLIRTVDLSSVLHMHVYGASIPKHLWDQVLKYFPNAKITAWYGMTEIGYISAGDPREANDSGSEFMDGYIIKIADEHGNRCGTNTIGELCLKRERSFRCYLDDHEATASTLDHEGFFRTGDIVYIDERGRLFNKDRKKNVATLFYFDAILLPSELDECLIDMAGVKEVCVVGVAVVSSAVLPAAVIVRQADSNLSKHDVFNKIAGKKSVNDVHIDIYQSILTSMYFH